jgi:YfiH family protein
MSSTSASPPADPAPGQVLLPDWPAPPGVNGFVTLRGGGASRGGWGRAGGLPGGWNLGGHCGDDPADVARNRALLRRLLPGEPRWLDQVHGTAVLDADAPGPAGERLPQADAAVTARPGTVVAVLTADCLPVLFCNESGSVAGVAHAGWRGLAQGVLERTVDALALRTGDRRWMAWLGPAIGPCCFEVGDEVRQAFAAHDPSAVRAFAAGAAPGKWQADLYALARLRLAGCGVHSVHGGGECTACDSERFYSYRRDRVTGRMVSVAWLA